MRARASTAALYLLGAAMFFWMIKIWADTPVVYKSWSTQECERVEDPAGEHDCGNLPEKYDLVWTE
jgi:hypothetical protein